MGNFLFSLLEGIIVTLCLPFYLIAIPIAKIIEYFRKRKPINLGMEVVHWPLRDVREDLKVVDVSRLREGFVGVWKRRYNVLRHKAIPPYEEQVHYITITQFWVPLRVRTVDVSLPS
jgi:hypothetical protein